jgi:phosphatidylglycerol:prolipoprotein diacylglycerol transferase
MHPVLFDKWGLEIHAYGLMLAISFLIGIYWAMFRAKRRGIDRSRIMDLSLIVVICAIIGSRFLYVVTHLEEFKGNWVRVISPFEDGKLIGISGLTMLGGVVLALIAIVVYCRIRGISILKLCDVMAPSFGFGIFLTRIGCYLNGCCYGKPCHWQLGVRFPVNSLAGNSDLLHPTQLYSSLYGLIILVVILIMDRKSRFDGFITSVFLMLYGLFRFLVDFVRYYEETVQFTILGQDFTVNQAISFLFFVTGLVLFLLVNNSWKGSTKKP